MNKDIIITELVTELYKNNPVQTPSQSIKCKDVITGEGYVAYINHFRKFSGLVHTLTEELSNSEVCQLWFDLCGESNSPKTGHTISTRVFDYPPIISNSCIHVLLIITTNKNDLENAKAIMNRYMTMYNVVAPIEPKKTLKKSGKKANKGATYENNKKRPNFLQEVLYRFLNYLLSAF